MKANKIKKILINVAIKVLGGAEGIIELALDWFNDEVLAKIKDPEEAAAYCTDVEQFAEFLDGVFKRHEKWMSEARRVALCNTIDAVKELATALKDVKIEKSELDSIVDKVKAAIDAWLAAK